MSIAGRDGRVQTYWRRDRGLGIGYGSANKERKPQRNKYNMFRQLVHLFCWTRVKFQDSPIWEMFFPNKQYSQWKENVHFLENRIIPKVEEIFLCSKICT